MRDINIEPRWDVLPPCDKIPYIDNQHPVKRPPVLAPYDPPAPPQHTQISPKCFTCEHFDMCRYKRDYFKTLTLIQNDLGDPAFSYQMTSNYAVIPGFDGLPIKNELDYFPKEIVFDNSDNLGKFFGAKFDGINYINAVYKDARYFILIKLNYSDDSQLYELKSCKEAFYKVEYELNKDSLEAIQLGLMEWREKVINSRLPVDHLPPRPRDIINTTHFSASLDCEFYKWNRESLQDAVNRLKKKYPYGIPIDEHGQEKYHIATYHVIDCEVPFSPYFKAEKMENEKPFFPPPPPPPKAKPKRRGDL